MTENFCYRSGEHHPKSQKGKGQKACVFIIDYLEEVASTPEYLCSGAAQLIFMPCEDTSKLRRS